MEEELYYLDSEDPLAYHETVEVAVKKYPYKAVRALIIRLYVTNYNTAIIIIEKKRAEMIAIKALEASRAEQRSVREITPLEEDL